MLHYLDSRALLLMAVGAAMFFAVWIPNAISRRGAAPLMFLGLSAVVGFFLGPWPVLSTEDAGVWEGLTEFAVIVSLFGAGLQIDRVQLPHRWHITQRLLFVAMPLSIAAVAGLGWALGLGVPAAVLLGAVLAPTDPVMATDVQVGPPGEGGEDEVRFGLTSEAGFNDSLAFPFVYLAIRASKLGTEDLSWMWEWFGVDVVHKLVVGTLAGLGCGWLLGNFVYRWPKDKPLASKRQGSMALAIVVATYGLTEAVEGYGFLAVFLAGYVVRRIVYHHDYNETMHEFTENTEHALMALVLILLGSMAPTLFADHLDWAAVAVAAALIFVIRPAAGLISLTGTPLSWLERGAIAYFGIRGLGSLYYLAYAVGQAPFDQEEWLWTTVTFVVLASTIFHGLTATPVMDHIARRLGRPTSEERDEAAAKKAAEES